jgi:GNAT superfamily N-acetyltransferase
MSASPIRVVPADGRRLRREFVELPYRLYASDPCFVPMLRRDEHRRFDPKHNPFLEHADIRPWLAMRGSRVVGRIAAIDDRLHNDTHSELVTWFGFLEAIDSGIARALLQTVEAHAAARGSAAVRGPVNPSLHEAAGLLIEGFNEPPAALMPYNPPAYAAFIEGAGYVKVKDLYAWNIDLTLPLPERITRIAGRARRRFGISVRTVDLSKFDSELDILKVIYRQAWVDNWSFVPPTDAEIRQLAIELKPVADPELVLFAEMNGEPVACAVSIPDVNEVLKKMNGRLLPFGILHFLRRRRIINRVRMLLLGVLPQFRRLGLYPLLVSEAVERAARRGYLRGEVGWTLEDNDLINTGIAAAGATHYKTYRLYEKPVG